MSNNKQVVENPDTSAVIDNIGDFPFILTANWVGGKLHIMVEQPRAGCPWPKNEFSVNLLPCKEDE